MKDLMVSIGNVYANLQVLVYCALLVSESYELLKLT